MYGSRITLLQGDRGWRNCRRISAASSSRAISSRPAFRSMKNSFTRHFTACVLRRQTDFFGQLEAARQDSAGRQNQFAAEGTQAVKCLVKEFFIERNAGRLEIAREMTLQKYGGSCASRGSP